MSNSGTLVRISANVGAPLMIVRVAQQFEKLRVDVRVLSGHDFLGRLADCYRDAKFVSGKDGVAFRSNHKTGRAFDYDQTPPYLFIQKEPFGGKMFFRTFLYCAKQDGSLGVKMTVKDYRGYSKEAYFVDFTALAKEHGFDRIPAWRGWEKTYNRREFWHYEDMTENGRRITWDEAMLMLKGKVRQEDQKVYGSNDRGEMVVKIQQRLAELGMLPQIEVDGIFGAKTRAAVIEFQKSKNLDKDGLVGPKTWAALFPKKEA